MKVFFQKGSRVCKLWAYQEYFYKADWVHCYVPTGGKSQLLQYLPPLSSDRREEGGSHIVLSSYKGSIDSSYPHRTDFGGLPSENIKIQGERGGKSVSAK